MLGHALEDENILDDDGGEKEVAEAEKGGEFDAHARGERTREIGGKVEREWDHPESGLSIDPGKDETSKIGPASPFAEFQLRKHDLIFILRQ